MEPEKNKILVIYHRIDIDGWLSAAIVKHYFETTQSGDVQLYPYNYGNDIPLNNIIKEFDEVVMVDVSLTLEQMIKLSRGLHLTYIDHHKAKVEEILGDKRVKINFKVNTETDPFFKKAACELTWEYFFDDNPLPEIVKYASDYDCFRHKAYDITEQQRVLYSQYGLRTVIYDVDSAYKELKCCIKTDKVFGDSSLKYMIHMFDKGKAIYDYLIVEAKMIYDTTRVIDIDGFVCGIVNRERFNPVNFEIDYHADGYDAYLCYHRAGGKWNFSIYNDNGEVDCSEIAKRFGGGGHPGASGFRIDDIDMFLADIIVLD